MNRRKLQLIALVVALPMAALVSLSSWLSWQPHVTTLAPLSPEELAMARNERTDFFWRASGLTLSRRLAPKLPASVRNWNGATFTLRSLAALRCDLDEKGDWGARVRPRAAGASQTEILEIAGKSADAPLQSVGTLPDAKNFGYNALAISPDGTRVAGDFSSQDSVGKNGATATKTRVEGVRISDTRTGKTRCQFTIPAQNEGAPDEEKRPDPSEICALAWAPDNRQLAVVGLHRIWILDGQNARILRTWRKNATVTILARWSPDGKYLGLANGVGDFTGAPATLAKGPSASVYLTIYDARKGRVQFGWAQGAISRANVQGVALGVTNFDFSPDGAQLVWGTWNGDVMRADLNTRFVEAPFDNSAPDDAASPVYVAFAPDGATLAVAAPDKITLWRLK